MRYASTSATALWLSATWQLSSICLPVAALSTAIGRSTRTREVRDAKAIMILTLLTISCLDVCQPAVSAQVVWVYLAFNIITDVYLLSIPLPMLWKASLKPLKKMGLMILFGGGILVIACATLRCVLIITVRRIVGSRLTSWYKTDIYRTGPRQWCTIGRLMGRPRDLHRRGHHKPTNGLPSLLHAARTAYQSLGQHNALHEQDQREHRRPGDCRRRWRARLESPAKPPSQGKSNDQRDLQRERRTHDGGSGTQRLEDVERSRLRQGWLARPQHHQRR
jgi:hypothetical protein